MVDFKQIIASNYNAPIVNEDRTPTLVFVDWITRITNSVSDEPIFGTGSPEGNVQGIPNQFYVQTDESVGQRLWIKQTNNGTTGWLQL